MPEPSLTPVAARTSSAESDRLVALCTEKAMLLPSDGAGEGPPGELSVATFAPSVRVQAVGAGQRRSRVERHGEDGADAHRADGRLGGRARDRGALGAAAAGLANRE